MPKRRSDIFFVWPEFDERSKPTGWLVFEHRSGPHAEGLCDRFAMTRHSAELFLLKMQAALKVVPKQ